MPSIFSTTPHTNLFVVVYLISGTCLSICFKDLLYEGNKIYAPSRCCLLPKELNATLNTKRHDKTRMKELYEKYKNDLPYYIRLELYKLTI